MISLRLTSALGDIVRLTSSSGRDPGAGARSHARRSDDRRVGVGRGAGRHRGGRGHHHGPARVVPAWHQRGARYSVGSIRLEIVAFSFTLYNTRFLYYPLK